MLEEPKRDLPGVLGRAAPPVYTALALELDSVEDATPMSGKSEMNASDEVEEGVTAEAGAEVAALENAGDTAANGVAEAEDDDIDATEVGDEVGISVDCVMGVNVIEDEEDTDDTDELELPNRSRLSTESSA